MSSLFSLDNILLEEENININSNNTSVIDLDNIGYADTDYTNYSFVRESYSFILEMNRDIIEADKYFYASILESYGNTEIINESFSDFFKKIKDIIKKFIDWIKKIFKEFSIKLHQLFKSDKYLKDKKNRAKLLSFSDEHEFTYKGYKFTNLTDSIIPISDSVNAFSSAEQGESYFAFDNNLNTKYYNYNGDNSAGTIEDITDKDSLKDYNDKINDHLKTQYDKLSNSLEDFYDDFRGSVIGETRKIDTSEFAEELFKKFRDDEDKPEDITINSMYVSEAYNRFNSYKDRIKTVEKNQKQMIKNYEALEKYLDKMIKSVEAEYKYGSGKDVTKYNIYDVDLQNTASNDYAKTNIDTLIGSETSHVRVGSKETVDKMNSYVKLQSSKVSTMCQIHTQAFAARLQAEKDQYNQDKSILYKALAKITKKQKTTTV